MKKAEELKGAVERLNASLEGAGYQVRIGHRNGYTAIDKYRTDGRMIDYIEVCKNDSEALRYIYFACKVAEMIHAHKNA